MFRYCSLLVVAVALLLLASAANAQQGDPHAPLEYAESHYQLAVRFFGEGRYREAVAEFDRAIALSPEPIFYCNRAVVLLQLKEADEALKSLQTCRDTFVGDNEELRQIDAQTGAIAVFVGHLRPNAMRLGAAIADRALALPVEPPASRDAQWGASDYGYLSLATGAALLASAATLDWLSADLREEFLLQSNGGANTSSERHAQLEEQIHDRQRVFLGLTIGGAVFSALGIGLVGYHFLAGEPLEPAASLSLTPVFGIGLMQWRLGLNF
ncbi:MAG: tetratricopeptide repeat protein [Bradymonadaceae bacterium]|nr:tetratricopeptide repeat protein [Lujinxingiaceae bacterium]